MTGQTSRLAIVIDSGDAEKRVERLRRALGSLGGSANTAGAGANAASTATQRLGRDANTTTTSIDRLRAASSRLIGPIDTLKSSFAGLFAAVGVLSIFNTADAMQSLNSKIKLATNSSEEYLTVQGKLRDMAQSNLTQYNSLVDLYASSRRALKQLGKTQNETLAFTENITKAMFVGGGAATSQAAALVQLGQALASGVLRGDEFNSIAEQAPILLELVAQKMGVAQGALRKLAADGKISSRILYDAISDATKKLSDMAAKMPATMGQAFETVRNKYKYFIDDTLNATGGFSSIVASALIGLGENLQSLIPILVAGGLAWGAYAIATSTAVTTSVVAATTSMASMGYAFLSNTALMKAQILSYFELNAMIARYSTNMMIARLTLANYKDIVITTALSIQAKVKAMQSSIAANIADAAAIVRNGEATFRLGLATIGATIAIVNKVNAMRSGVTVGGAYTAVLTGVAGVAAVATTAVTTLAGAIARLGGVINAHPIMFLAATLISVVAATEDAEGKTRGFTGAMASLSEAVKIVGSLFLDFVKFTIDGISSIGRVFGAFITSFVQNSESGANESSNMFAVFFSNTEGGFVGLLQVWARFSDLAAASIRNLIKSVVRGMSNLVKDVANKAAKMGNVLVDAFEWAAGGIAKTLNFISGGVGLAVKQLNKISPIQIGIEEREYAAPKLERFLADRALDVQGWSESMMPIMEDQIANGLSGTVQRAIDTTRIAAQQAKSDLDLVAEGMANIADADDKAKKKKAKKEKKPKTIKDKEAEAYAKLLESYNQQMAAYDKESFNLEAPFPTELRDMVFEIEHPFGKFVDLSDELKKNLIESAKSMDAVRVNATGKGMIRDLKREILSLDETNPLQSLLNNLNDVDNVLSTLDVSVMRDLQRLTVDLDVKKQSLSIADMNKEAERQLTLSNTVNELDRQRLEIGYEYGDMLEKFSYLKDVGLDSEYKALKVDLDRLKAVKDLMAANAAMRMSSDALTGVMGEIAQESPLGKIEADYQRRLEVINDYESQWTNLVGVHSAERTAIEQSYMDAKRDLMLTQSEAIFGGLAGMAKGFLGEQSGIYRALYTMQKAYALSSAVLSSKKAIMDAWANTPGTYFTKALAAGKVVLSTSAITNAISGLAPQGFKAGGYTGNMGVNQVAGDVHGQEYVFDAPSTKRIGVDNLNAIRSGKAPVASGGDNINVNVTVHSNGSSNIESDKQLGRNMGQVITAAVKQQLIKEKRQGGLLYG